MKAIVFVCLAIFGAFAPEEVKAKDLSSRGATKQPLQPQNAPPTNSITSNARKLGKIENPRQPSVPIQSTKPELSPIFHVSSDPRDQVQLSVSSDGVVTVQGSVGSQELAQKLIQQYGRMPGVREVHNQLTLRMSPDAKIAAQVREALSHDSETHVGGIAVTVCDGIVFLSGTVLTEEESARAEELARALPGVARVSNGLRFPTTPTRYPVRLTSGSRPVPRSR